MNQLAAVDPTPEDIQRFLAETGDGPVVMLNLLRYAEDGGRETYAEYGERATPFLEAVGGELLYAGECGPALVAPDGFGWDTILLVRYPSKEAFMAMVSNPDYLAITPIRTRALAAAVLQPTTPVDPGAGGHLSTLLKTGAPPSTPG
jgi:uncharacterized protein (DUF1330 family)